MQKITVYYFTKFDIKTGQEVRSIRMATFEYIDRIKGMPLWNTVKEVNVTDIDENGRYPRI
jgi:hypothetical protein